MFADKHCWVEDAQLSLFSPVVPTLFILMEEANAGNLAEYIEPQHQPPVESLDPITRAKMMRGLNAHQSVDYSTRYPNQEAISTGGIGYSRDGKTRVRYLTTREIIDMFTDILEGLKHLHFHGIVHQVNNLALIF
jgi:serine/threonine protein kinase